MALFTYEPPTLEIGLTRALGSTVLGPYYRGYVRSMNLRGDERVLDYGSGSGSLSRQIAAHLQRGGGCLDCVDISRRWMNTIRRTLQRYDHVGYHLGHIAQLDLPEGAFDAVVIHFVLHDIPAAERPGIVQTLGRRLAPTGRLIVREPQGHGLSLDELCELATEAGLQTTTMSADKVAIGAVYDACFAPTQREVL